MIRSLFLRTAAVVASLIFLAGPSFAAGVTSRPGGHRDTTGFNLNRPRVWFDSACTDSFNVPATTVNVDIRTLANWDSMAEAINPDKNILDAVQTSGSADGWCDSTPWIMKGALTGAGTVYIGPLKNIPYQGFLLEWIFASAAGNYQFFFCHKLVYDVATCRQDGGMAGIATTGSNLFVDVVPMVATGASQYSTFDNFWFVSQRDSYVQLILGSAGAYTMSVDTVPIVPYYERQGD